jgi:hypothetical protein
VTAPAVRQRLLALEHRYPAYLLTSLLPVLLMPLASSQAAGPQRLVMPLVFTLLVLQSLRTLPALDASPAQRRWVWLFRLCGFGALVAVWLVQALPMEMVPVQHLLPRLPPLKQQRSVRRSEFCDALAVSWLRSPGGARTWARYSSMAWPPA